MPNPSSAQQPRAFAGTVTPLCLAAELVADPLAPMHLARDLAAWRAEMAQIVAEIAADNGCTVAEVEAWLERQGT